MTVPIPGISQWSDFGSRVVIPYANTVAHLRAESIATVEKIIGHKFREPHLLAQAMVCITIFAFLIHVVHRSTVQTHSSVRTNGMTSYERLEFIGDAILDFSTFNEDTSRRSSSPKKKYPQW
jgi:endoribonuclease Dicer